MHQHNLQHEEKDPTQFWVINCIKKITPGATGSVAANAAIGRFGIKFHHRTGNYNKRSIFSKRADSPNGTAALEKVTA